MDDSMPRSSMAARRSMRFRLLCVEDDPLDYELMVHCLRDAGLEFDSICVDNEDDFVQELESWQPDIVVSDYSISWFAGTRALDLTRTIKPGLPFIFLSGRIGEDIATEAVRAGATDYVLKGSLVRLPHAIKRALEEARDRAAAAEMARQLALTHERLEAIIASVQDVLWSRAPDDRLLHIAPFVEEICGFPRAELFQRPGLWRELIHPDDRQHVARAWSQLHAAGVFDVEYRIVRRDGKVRWIHDRAHLVCADGIPQRIDGVARDITDRMVGRQRLARLSRIREITGRVNAALVRIRERQALFEEICRISVEGGGLTRVRIWLPDDAGTVMHVVASAESPGDEAYGKTFQDKMKLGCGDHPQMVERAWTSLRPQIANDVRRDLWNEYGNRLMQSVTRAVGAFPLIMGGKPVGVLIWQSTEVDFFDEEEIELVEELASNIAFAMEMIDKTERLNYLAYYDSVTGLPNRTLFVERLQQAIGEAARNRTEVAVGLIDIERFKVVNDMLGQQKGDHLLKLLADRLRHSFDADYLAHIWADQYAFFLPWSDGKESAARLGADEVAHALAQPFAIDGRLIHLNERIGVAVYPGDGADAAELFRNAEAALKKAKAGRERTAYFAPEINTRMSERMQLENRLRRAVERREFVLHLQPKVDMTTRRIVGAEALIRWNDPEKGLVFPGAFIDALEETRLILDVGRWALQEGARIYRGWREQGLPAVRIAVNVSAIQLQQPDFVEVVREALGADPQSDCGVDLEFTESQIMEDIESCVKKLTAIRALGLQLSLDDFGTGYSSLSYLSRLPLDSLKVDGSFVRGMVNSQADTSIVSAVISLAQSMRLKVVAEGVETEEQSRLLQLLRCDQMQGFLISRAVPSEQFEPLLKKQR